MATPHIDAENGAFAKTVLMPGDPMRSKYIAEHYLSAARLVNNVRGVQGYTGEYKGKPVSVMASGMGMPSIAIYAQELFSFFGVQNIIRAGSAGALSDGLRLRDIVIATEATTDSNSVNFFGFISGLPIAADDTLVHAAKSARTSSRTITGRLHSSDVFYAGEDVLLKNKADGAIAVEMEAAMLYAVAQKLGKRALAVCTVSDFALTGEGLTADEREQSFNDMITLALDTATAID